MPVKSSFSEVKNQVLNQIQQSNVEDNIIETVEVRREGSLSSNECVLSEDDNELNSVLCPRQRPFKKTYFQINKNAHDTSAIIKMNQSQKSMMRAESKMLHSKQNSEIYLDSAGQLLNKTQVHDADAADHSPLTTDQLGLSSAQFQSTHQAFNAPMPAA